MKTSSAQQSNEQKIIDTVTAQLDKEVSTLDESVADQLKQARKAALKQAMKSNESKGGRLIPSIHKLFSFETMTPVALAVCLVVLVNYLYQPTEPTDVIVNIPPIPKGLMGDAVPVEDLALLQELEFATWLSEHATAEEVSL